MRPAVFQPGIDTHYATRRVGCAFLRIQGQGKRRGIGLFGMKAQWLDQFVERAQHLRRIRPALLQYDPVMQGIEQPHQQKQRQHQQGDHRHAAAGHSSPGQQQMFVAAHIPRACCTGRQQHKHQRIAPQNDRHEIHERRTLGSTTVYEISVRIRPAIYSSEPKNTIARTTEKSCALIASIV